jgi:DNA repair protein RadD
MIQLRPYQEDGIEAIWNYFCKDKGNPLIAWPTGVGKSIIPAIFIQRVMHHWASQKFLLLTHVSELIKQNAEVLQYVWPNAPLGIFSAGLKKKQPFFPIVYAGIQSAIKDPARFGHRDIIFIDEAHLISEDESSQYLTFLATMKLINPNIKIIGMTATPFRMGMGMLTDGGLFTDIIHDLTGVDEFNRLIAEGYLSPLIPKRTKVELDITNVGMSRGEFIGSQLQSAVDKAEITYAGLREAVELGRDRKSWLIFSSGVEHADHIAAMLTSFGIDCVAVHSKKSADHNEQTIKHFKSNSLRAIVNYSKLTTGFNHPNIDLICDFRPTMAIPLHIQKLGRGTRPSDGKSNCLVLDFARNIPRLGPINDPVIPRKRGESGGDVPIKICEACGTYNHARVRYCTNCGNEFEFKIKIVAKAGTTEIIRSDIPVVEYFDVDYAIYAKKQKDPAKSAYIQASYFCGLRKFNEFVFPEAAKYGKHLFHQWWMQRHSSNPPVSTDEALKYVSELRCPKRIRVWVNKKYPEVLSAEY